MSEIEREEEEADVLFVGAGPANLAGALHLLNLVRAHNEKAEKGEAEAIEPPEVMILEKSAELGNHCLSGAVMDPKGWRELLGQDAEIPGGQPVTRDGFMMLTRGAKIPVWPIPPLLSNQGNVVVSIARLVRHLGERLEAEHEDAMLLTGQAAAQLLTEGEGDRQRVVGVQTQDVGILKNGEQGDGFEPGMLLKAKVTVLGEGTRGTLAKQLEKGFETSADCDPQHYALGVKEVWKVAPEKHKPGEVWHTLGWPLSEKQQVGGGWVYHMADGLVSLGLVTRLDYDDPMLDPFDEFQRQKLHPWIADLLEGGEMVEYGAKSIPEGGWFSLPKSQVPGCLVVGDSAGLVNGFKLKGIHYAIKSGMLAAEAIFAGLIEGKQGEIAQAPLEAYPQAVKDSYIGKELHHVRHFHSALGPNLYVSMAKIGVLIATGGHLLLGGRHKAADHQHMRDQAKTLMPELPKDARTLPKDNPLIFDRATALYKSDTAHEENQPSHLVVHSPEVCATCWEEFAAPCQRFCPAEVYRMETDETTGKPSLVLSPSNCVHCKTCDIKDPYENITWVVPEPTGGPRYKRT